MIIKHLLGHKFLLITTVVSTFLITWVSLAKFVSPFQFEVKNSDKLGHFIAYFVLTSVWIFFFFFSEKLNKNGKQSLGIASTVCILYGVLMEVLQALLTTYRNSDWYDIVANTSGTIFAALIFILFKSKLIKFKQNKQEIR